MKRRLRLSILLLYAYFRSCAYLGSSDKVMHTHTVAHGESLCVSCSRTCNVEPFELFGSATCLARYFAVKHCVRICCVFPCCARVISQISPLPGHAGPISQQPGLPQGMCATQQCPIPFVACVGSMLQAQELLGWLGFCLICMRACASVVPRDQ